MPKKKSAKAMPPVPVADGGAGSGTTGDESAKLETSARADADMPAVPPKKKSSKKPPPDPPSVVPSGSSGGGGGGGSGGGDEVAAIAAKIDSVAVEHADAPVPTPPRKKTVKKT